MMWWGDDHMGSGWWWTMGVGWLVFLALVVLLVAYLVRQVADRDRPPPQPSRPSAEDVLAERFARGEIDEEEFRRRRDALRA